MCGSCAEPGDDHGRSRWTTTHLLLLAFVLTLAGLSAAGLALRLSAGGRAAQGDCSAAATAYQLAVTRDLSAGRKVLLADTAAFERQVESVSRCLELRKFVVGTASTLTPICPACVRELARTVGRPG